MNSMMSEDDDIEKTRRQDQSLAGKARDEARDRERALRLFSKKALQAKKS